MAVHRWEDFSGGLRTDVYQSLINDNESPDCKNVWTPYGGALTKRPGINRLTTGSVGFDKVYTATLTPLKEPWSGHYVQYLYGFTPNTAGSPDNAMARTSSGGGSWTSGQPTNPILDSSRPVYMNNKIYINTTAGIESDDASSGSDVFSLVSGSPIAHLICSYKGFLFGAVDSGEAVFNTLQWSSLGDPTLWPTSFKVVVGAKDGLAITGLQVYGDSLYIFKGPRYFNQTTQSSGASQKASIYKLTGDSVTLSNATYQLEELPLSQDTACIFPHSIGQWDERMVFLSQNGVMSFDGNSLTNITSKIYPTTKKWFQFKTDTYFTNLLAKEPTIAIDEGRLFLSQSETGTESDRTGILIDNTMNVVYCFEPEGRIWRWTNSTGISAMAVDSAGSHIAIGWRTGWSSPAGAAAAFYRIDRTDILYDDARADESPVGINAKYRTKEFDFKQLQHFKYAYVDFSRQKSGILNVRYNVDQKGWVERKVDMSGTYGSIKRSQRLLIGDHGRTIQFEFANNEAYVNFEIFGLELHTDVKHLDNTGGSPSVAS